MAAGPQLRDRLRMIAELPKLYTLEEAVDRLHVKDRKLKEEIRAGNLECFRIGKSVYLFTDQHLMDYLERHCRRATCQTESNISASLDDTNSTNGSDMARRSTMPSGTTTEKKRQSDDLLALAMLRKPSGNSPSCT